MTAPLPPVVAAVDAACAQLATADEALALGRALLRSLTDPAPEAQAHVDQLMAEWRRANAALTQALHAYNRWLLSHAPDATTPWPDPLARQGGA